MKTKFYKSWLQNPPPRSRSRRYSLCVCSGGSDRCWACYHRQPSKLSKKINTEVYDQWLEELVPGPVNMTDEEREQIGRDLGLERGMVAIEEIFEGLWKRFGHLELFRHMDIENDDEDDYVGEDPEPVQGKGNFASTVSPATSSSDYSTKGIPNVFDEASDEDDDDKEKGETSDDDASSLIEIDHIVVDDELFGDEDTAVTGHVVKDGGCGGDDGASPEPEAAKFQKDVDVDGTAEGTDAEIIVNSSEEIDVLSVFYPNLPKPDLRKKIHLVQLYSSGEDSEDDYEDQDVEVELDEYEVDSPMDSDDEEIVDLTVDSDSDHEEIIVDLTVDSDDNDDMDSKMEVCGSDDQKGASAMDQCEGLDTAGRTGLHITHFDAQDWGSVYISHYRI